MTTQTLPPISASLQGAIRAYGLENGWKNAARELAYGPVTDGDMSGYILEKAEEIGKNQRKLASLRRHVTRRDNGYFPHVPGISRNAAGGFKCSKPGGYDRAGTGHENRVHLTGETLEAYLRRVSKYTAEEWDRRGVNGTVEISRAS